MVRSDLRSARSDRSEARTRTTQFVRVAGQGELHATLPAWERFPSHRWLRGSSARLAEPLAADVRQQEHQQEAQRVDGDLEPQGPLDGADEVALARVDAGCLQDLADRLAALALALRCGLPAARRGCGARPARWWGWPGSTAARRRSPR